MKEEAPGGSIVGGFFRLSGRQSTGYLSPIISCRVVIFSIRSFRVIFGS